MDIFNNPALEKNAPHAKTIKGILIGISLSIIGMLGIIIFFYYLGGQKTEMLVMGINILPILAALELARINRTEAAGTIIAFMLTFMVTVLATIGQGINDIGVMALPAILLIASLILRREITISLTLFMIVCCGWLVYGQVFGVYQPVPPEMPVTRFFVITALILIVTSWTVQLISRMVIRNFQALQKELQEREKVEKELREAEMLYRALVEQTSVVTYRDAPDLTGATMYISPQVESMLGYSLDEWKNNPVIWKSITHPDDLPHVLAGIAGYIANGEPAQIEYRIQTKSGQWKWVRDESVVIKDEQGNFNYVHGVLIDITERKETEQKLKQREAILSAVAFTAQQLLKSSNWRDDIQGILARLGEATLASHVYIFENHSGEEGIALSSQKYEWARQGIQPDLGNPVYQNTRLYPPPGMEDWFSCLSTGRPFYGSARQYPRYWKRVFEARGLKTLLDMPIFVNGQWWGIIGFDDYVHELPWSQAEIDALVAAAGNLGTAIERQLTVDQLRVSEEKFHMAFHHTYAAMAISRASDNRLLDVNEAFCKITGFSREEAIGKRAGRDLNIWVHQEDRNFIFSALDTEGFVDEYKSRFRRKNGEVGVGLVSALNIHVGREACQLFSFYDISRIEQLLDELKAKNEELQSFTYTVSHDLKAPLVTISGFLGYLGEDARKGDMERLNRDILRINEAAAKMHRLLSELLELSRIGRIMNPPEVVPFEAIVHEALGLVEGRLKAKQIHVHVEAGLPAVYGDRLRLVEVVQNLLDNAARFMGESTDPKIVIGVETRNGKNAFFVRDNGIGIKPEFHEKVFGLFNKLDANTEGTGIGLALVKRIIEVHGGRVWVESEGMAKGSTFFFTLAEHPEQAAK
jgi:PAS domain S-box-containing protein